MFIIASCIDHACILKPQAGQQAIAVHINADCFLLYACLQLHEETRCTLQIWDLKRVELSQPIQIPGLCIIENANAKPKRIAVTNCHFHDGLNCGIDCKGAHKILIANNVVERTRVSGIVAAEDHWWGEGGMAGTPRNLSVTL